jgi:uncharacterized protein YbjQ (UPF0145 family)
MCDPGQIAAVAVDGAAARSGERRCLVFRFASPSGGPAPAWRSVVFGALEQALSKLRAAAQEKNANAVINVQTRFHSTETRSATDFTCGVSPSAAAVAVRGDLVVLQNN